LADWLVGLVNSQLSVHSDCSVNVTSQNYYCSVSGPTFLLALLT